MIARVARAWLIGGAGLVASAALTAAPARAQGPAAGATTIVEGSGDVAGTGALPYSPRRAVFRPAFDIPTRRPLVESGYEFPTKPLFLKGYAGNTYGQAPREVFVPTGYGTGYIRPMGAAATPSPQAPCNPGPFRRWFRR